MGGKYCVLARNYSDVAWRVADYTDSFLKAFVIFVKAWAKCELVEFSIRK